MYMSCACACTCSNVLHQNVHCIQNGTTYVVSISLTCVAEEFPESCIEVFCWFLFHIFHLIDHWNIKA